jgi:hypothetical protein
MNGGPGSVAQESIAPRSSHDANIFELLVRYALRKPKMAYKDTIHRHFGISSRCHSHGTT